jgi:hypothetical protein
MFYEAYHLYLALIRLQIKAIFPTVWPVLLIVMMMFLSSM